MTKSRRILTAEQIEAHREEARLKNPNKEVIDELRKKVKDISIQIGELTSDEEKYCNILLFLCKDFDSKKAAVKVMTNQELGSHLANLFYTHVNNEVDESILNEALERLGYDPESDEEQLT